MVPYKIFSIYIRIVSILLYILRALGAVAVAVA